MIAAAICYGVLGAAGILALAVIGAAIGQLLAHRREADTAPVIDDEADLDRILRAQVAAHGWDWMEAHHGD